jgi:CAAX amino terminal protease family.
MSEPNSNSNDNKKIKNTVIAPLLAAVVSILLILSFFLDKELLQYQDNLYLSVIILYILVLVMPGIFYSKLKGTGYVDKLNFRLFGPNKFLFLIFIFLALVCGTMILKLFQYGMGIYSPVVTYFDRYLPSGSLTTTNALYVILAYAVLPAVAEEFIFRGVILTEYADGGVGQINAMFLTALLYAMSYFNFVQFPVRFVIGIVFAMVLFVTQSLVATMVMHTLYNLFIIYTEDYMMRLAAQTGNLLLYITIMLICVFIFVIFAFGNAEKIYYRYSVEKDDTPYIISPSSGGAMKRFAEAGLSPTFLACLFIFFLAAITFR